MAVSSQRMSWLIAAETLDETSISNLTNLEMSGRCAEGI